MLYPYTADLLTMDLCRPEHPHNNEILTQIVTPLDANCWEVALRHHPDIAYAAFLIRGLREGFRIGFQRKATLRLANSNMPSTRLHLQVITEYINKEVGKGRMLGPLPQSCWFWRHDGAG